MYLSMRSKSMFTFRIKSSSDALWTVDTFKETYKKRYNSCSEKGDAFQVIRRLYKLECELIRYLHTYYQSIRQMKAQFIIGSQQWENCSSSCTNKIISFQLSKCSGLIDILRCVLYLDHLKNNFQDWHQVYTLKKTKLVVHSEISPVPLLLWSWTLYPFQSSSSRDCMSFYIIDAVKFNLSPDTIKV
ncbi:UNVERIFIED_CONTAM: hypothetical protein NCL1_22401 [Trichonephila clavipes]